jgi:hypothetical protein
MSSGSRPRWDPYVLHAGRALREHWESRFAAGAKVALLQGVGFDPRMCLVLELMRELAPVDSVDVWAVSLGAPGNATAHAAASANAEQFAGLLEGGDRHDLDVSASGLEETARRAAGAIGSLDALGAVTDIVVDVNALPRPVFFPLVAKLLYLCDQRHAEAPNLHVLAGDAAWLDAEIHAEGIDEHAAWLHPFAGTFGVEATLHVPRIWMPVLGEGTATQLERISELITPAEVCPLLPFPSRDPRRGDELFLEYQAVLFDQLRTDSGTVMYAAESNPFQIYRRLRQSTIEHAETLTPLGGCKTAYSALSSKLVAVGVLLVAYELRDLNIEIGVADIGAQGHTLNRRYSGEEVHERTELVGLTLSGDCYL